MTPVDTTPLNTTSQSRKDRIESLAQRVQTVAMNKQVLHTLPFAKIDDWALECFFDPIDNEDELSTPEQDRMRAIRIAGFAKQAAETLDEMREIALALFQSRYGGEQGGQVEQTEHTGTGTGTESEFHELTEQRVADAPVQLSMDPSASSSSPGYTTSREHMKPEDDVWAEVSGVEGMTGEQHLRAAMIKLGEDQTSHYGLQSGVTEQGEGHSSEPHFQDNMFHQTVGSEKHPQAESCRHKRHEQNTRYSDWTSAPYTTTFTLNSIQT